MKPYFTPLFMMLGACLPNAQAQFFNQDFNVSNTATNYVAATPNIRQFDGFNTTSSAAMTVTTTEGLNFIRGATAGAKAAATRVTDIAGIGTTNAYIVRLNITQCTGTSAGNAIAAQIQFGSGFNDNSAVEANNKVFGEFYINNSVTNNQFRTSPEGTTLSTSTAVGTTNTARITVAFNKSGSSKSYMPPSATNPPFTLETVATGTMDIWIGTTRMSNDVAIPAGFTTTNITDFKIIFAPSISTTLSLDDISMFPIGTPAGTYTLGVNNSGATNPVSTVTSTFTSLTRNGGGLFEVLNYSGAILGNVTANVTNSTIAAINPENGVNDLKEITGMADNTISILPASAGVKTIEGTQNGNLILFNGADNVLVDGNNAGTLTLLFRNNDTGNNANNSVFNFINDATNNTVKNAIVEGLHTANNTGLIRISTTTATTGNDNLTFENLTIQNSSISPPTGGTGATTTTNVPRCAIFSDGTVSKENSTISIKNCRFVNIYSGANNSRNVLINSNTQNLTLEDCHFFQTVSFFGNASLTSYSNLIEIGGTGTDNVTVRNNFFGGRALNCGGAKYVYSNPNNNRNRLRIISSSMAATANLTFTGNTIQNVQIDFQGTTTTGQDAFGVFNGSGKAIVSNNIIGSTTIANSFAFSQTTNNAVTPTTAGIQYINFTGTAGEIKNNIIAGQTYTFVGTPTFGFDVIGIRLANSGAGVEVSGNIIGSTTQTDNILVSNTTSANFFSGITIVATGTNSSTIQNNNIQNITNNSTNIGSTIVGISQTGTANTTIQNNTIYSLTSTAQQANVSDNVAVAGIRINAATGAGLQVRGNTIHTIQSAATTSTTSAGILLTGGVQGHIRDNRIYNIRNTSASAQPVAAGVVVRSIGTALYFYNNRISLGLETNGTNNTEQAIYTGVWNNLHDTDNLFLAFNSVHIGGQASGGMLKTYAFLQGDNPSATIDVTLVNTPLQVYNNIFQNARTNGGNNIAIAVQDATPFATAPCGGGNAPDYNVFYASDETKTGERAGIAYGFTAWKTASGADINSYSANTGGVTAIAFTLPETGDLHLNANDQRPDGKATPISTNLGFPITIDFDVDNEFRRSTDAGADEYEQTLVFVQVNDNWHDPVNWQVQGSTPPRYSVPNCADNVVIPNRATVRVYNSGTENPTNIPAFFYTMTVQNGGTVELKNGTNTYSCWYNDELTSAQVHKGEIKIESGGTLIGNASNLYASGRFTNSGNFQKGTNITYLNHDAPNTGNACLDSYVSTYNSANLVSNIGGASNTNFHNLTISNNGNTTILNNSATDKQMRVGDATTDTGNLNITGTGWLYINNNRLMLEGDLTENTGAIAGSTSSDLVINGKDALTGTIKLRTNNGTDNQFRNLRLNRNNKGLIKFSTANSVASIIVNTQLELSNGIAQMGVTTPLTDILMDITNTVDDNATGAVMSYLNTGGSSGTSWVYGRIRRALNGAVGKVYDYPVGDATRYELMRMTIANANFIAADGINPIQLTGYFNGNNASATVYGVMPYHSAGSLIEATYGYNGISTGGFWNLTPNNITVSKYDMQLFPVGILAPFIRPTIGKSVVGVGAWDFYGSTYVNANKRTDYSEFSDFAYIHTQIPLPLVFLSFAGKEDAGKASLQWKTTNEVNTAHFIIERSMNVIDFLSVGKVDANGNTTTLSIYNFIDDNPLQGVNYYRLKQVDKDGRFVYSPMIAITFKGEDMLLFPNPNAGTFQIRLPAVLQNTTVKMSIIDALGHTVVTQTLPITQNTTLPITKNLPKGLYIIMVNTTGKVYRKKMIVL